MPRTLYAFADFELSPGRRQLRRGGREVPLIPRYFDLLVLLVDQRREAVHRRDIVARVWSDVIVTDGALSQGVRILRRVLGDDHKEPRFIRTVSRHGYQFVYPGVEERADAVDSSPVSAEPRAAVWPISTAGADPFEAPLALLAAPGPAAEPDTEQDAQREAAETLHALGTEEALRRLGMRLGHERARALLRDSRWDVPGAGPVPLLGTPGAARTIASLVRLRAMRALRVAGERWASAAGGGALAGLIGGILGGLALQWGPGSTARGGVPLALGFVGAAVGGVGAAGVGAGLAAAETFARSARATALVALGTLGGGAVGAFAHLFALVTLQGLFGKDLSPVGGGFEGLVIGAACGLGYALSTPRPDGGMAAPRGSARVRTALVTGLACGIGCALLAAGGRHLGAMSLDFMAHSFPGSQVALDPLARLLGEARPGPITSLVVSAGEGLFFGAGLAFGLTRRS